MTIKQPLRTLSLRVLTKKDLKIITDFTTLAIVSGKGVQQTLLDLLARYISENKGSLNNRTLVSETELLRRIKALGFTTTHGTLKLYRRKGYLKDSEGPWFYKNVDSRVRYDWEKMKKFIADRNKRPYSRITK